MAILLLCTGWCLLLFSLSGMARCMLIKAPVIVSIGVDRRVVFYQRGWSYVGAQIERKRVYWRFYTWTVEHSFDSAVKGLHGTRISTREIHEMSESGLNELAKAMMNKATKEGRNGL